VSLTVNADNGEARALYDSSGFSEKARSTIDGQDVLLMAQGR
jgi:ribosomal protein S18 acetylase RimI-like enzyme